MQNKILQRKKALRTVLLIFLMSSMGVTKAAPVSIRVAQEVCLHFVNANSQMQLRNTSELQLITAYSTDKGNTAFYIFNFTKGFVIVSANDVAHPVLAYNFNRPWPNESDLPSQVTGYLDDLANQIEAASRQMQDKGIALEWSDLLSGNYQTRSNREQVGPLLTTTWDQGQYYNAMCPEDENGPGGHAVTGCTATAIAQIIKYWGYPVRGRGLHSYQSDYGEISVNYEESVYSFEDMPDVLTPESLETEINTVAKLISDCGVAVNMMYSANESSAYNFEARAALIDFFKFGPNVNYAEKSFFEENEWNLLLISELDENRPIYYTGRGTAGHAFVCDGYNVDGYYHFNFGWSGNGNGWYLTEAVNPMGLDFSSNQAAILGIAPNENGNVIIGQMQGTSTFNVEMPFEFYHILGNNLFTVTNYGNECENTISFVSNEVDNHMVVDVISFDADVCNVYDGMDNSYLLRGLSDSQENLSPIESFSNSVTLVYAGRIQNYGFHLHIQKDDDCRIISDIATNVDTSSVCLTWQENGTADHWEIEVGEKGFALGEGDTFSVDTNYVCVNGLEFNKRYDFYIRPSCGSDMGGMWNKTTASPDKPYWHEKVSVQPEGYRIDSCGNVYITSEEGLAWFNVLANGYNGENRHSFTDTTVYLVSDCNIGQYKWMPIYYFSGTFDGGNHTISNLYINEDRDTELFLNMYSVGMFRICRGGAVIKDLVLNKAYVTGGGGVGSLIGSLHIMDQFYNTPTDEDGASLINVHAISAEVYGTAWVGGLVGDASYLYAVNCSSSGVISGSQAVGGLFGRLMDSYCSNAYSTAKLECDHVSISTPAWYRGGAIGLASRDTIYNCYASGFISYDEYDPEIIAKPGMVVGTAEQTNVFASLYGYDNNQSNQLYGTDGEPFPIVSDTSSFIDNGGVFGLNNVITINGTFYTELLSSLNAWVDANNSENLYSHWVADSAMVNGGFPLLGCQVGHGIAESETIPVSIYPNPTNGRVTIEAKDLKHIIISNMLGQTIYDGNVIGNEFIYDFSNHNAGVYLIRIKTTNGVAVKKVSVTR